MFALTLTVESLTLSLTGVYELYLDQLYAPSAPAIVVPIFVMLGYAWRSRHDRASEHDDWDCVDELVDEASATWP